MDDGRPIGPHGCNAMARTTGEPCKNNPGPGAVVCHMHGGKAPQVARKAAERAREDEARRACAALGLPIETDAAEALQDELNHTYGAVVWLRAKLAEWGTDALAWGETERPGGRSTAPSGRTW